MNKKIYTLNVTAEIKVVEIGGIAWLLIFKASWNPCFENDYFKLGANSNVFQENKSFSAAIYEETLKSTLWT